MKKWDGSDSVGQADEAEIDLSKGLPRHKGDCHETRALKKTKRAADGNGIICGNLNNIQEAPQELDPTMEGVWIRVGFRAARSPGEAATPNLHRAAMPGKGGSRIEYKAPRR